VRRWSKKFDPFACEHIFCPVNLHNTHWTLAVVSVQEKQIRYYDSMGGGGALYLQSLLSYMKDEAAKRDVNFDSNEWTLSAASRSEYPQQGNGYDCGVFCMTAVDFLSDGLPLSFSQKDMSLFRRRAAADILRQSLLYQLH
jgi:sentrin-specific protease 1